MAANRYEVLDGWRGISILAVLACHLLPIGPKVLALNYAAGLLGMSLFFTLSGFLVTQFLLYKPNVVDFLIRRFFRILPLAWLYIFIALLLYPSDINTWLAHLFFYANYPPKPLVPHITEHLWSLCVEMHFYLGIALLVAIFKKRGLLLIPFICLAVTCLRVFYGQHDSVITHFRVDEILAGSTLALIYDKKLGDYLPQILGKLNFFIILVILLISCHQHSGFMNYFRPYFAAILVGITLFRPDSNVGNLLKSRILFYIASISYALYVIHPLLAASWLGSGDKLVEYLKRPLLFLVLFITAHVSTFYYERKWIDLSHRLTKRKSVADSNAASLMP